MNLVFDIETNGLEATEIFCMAAKDLTTNEIYRYTPNNIMEGFDLIERSELLVGHNILGFDIPVLKRLTDIDFKSKQVIDTLVLSRLAKPNRGKHSLGAWGYHLDFLKGKTTEGSFERYSPELLEYCVNDVELNTLVFNELKKELKDFDNASIEIEHEVSVILREQEDVGFLLDVIKADELLASLNTRQDSIVETVHKIFKPKLLKIKEVQPKKKLNGDLSRQGLSDEEYNNILAKDPKDRLKPFDRMKLTEFNLGSRPQIAEYLQDFGWKPEAFTPTGLPKIGEEILSSVADIPEAQLIATYLMIQDRMGQISSWFEHLDPDNRVRGCVISNGAITHRMSHFKPNMAQVTSLSKPYGRECRECWTVPKDYKLVGIDASGLELRMLAHYLKDKEFIDEILTGDVHERNKEFAGLESRDTAKTFVYALLYGAGDGKLGSLVEGDAKDGAAIRKRFLANFPSLKDLTDTVERTARTRKFIKSLDGRLITVRNSNTALNTLLQGAGAVTMKQALINFNKALKDRSLDARIVANVHDEWQVEAHHSIAEEVGLLGVDAIRKVTEDFKLKCPLDGEYKIGDNWSETH